MSQEFNALTHNNTWELVPRNNQNLIGCKWVFRIKRKSDGSVDRFKAWLVAKGFHQRPGLDYSETFAPVTKSITVRIILSLALSQGWLLRQLDVNNAFLNGTLQENVYMVQPPGFVNSEFPDYVCKLKKTIYGLKQANREWYKELKSFLTYAGFQSSISDSSLFIYHHNGIIMYFLVYVDDIIVTGNNNDAISEFIQALNSKFSLKDLGNLSNFLGVEVINTTTGIFLSQHKYILDILIQHNMAGCKEVSTPLQHF